MITAEVIGGVIFRAVSRINGAGGKTPDMFCSPIILTSHPPHSIMGKAVLHVFAVVGAATTKGFRIIDFPIRAGGDAKGTFRKSDVIKLRQRAEPRGGTTETFPNVWRVHVVVVHVDIEDDAHVLQVAHAGDGTRLGAGLGKCGQQHASQNRNDCDDDQQFNQSEGFFHLDFSCC